MLAGPTTCSWPLIEAYWASGCTETEKFVLPSPGEGWGAVVHDTRCQGVFLFESSETFTVLVARHGAAVGGAKPVLTVDDFTDDWRKAFTLRWLSDRELEITVPNLSQAALIKPVQGPVAVTLRYDPDDKVARERWRQHLEGLRTGGR